jgi:hypothetical protein
MKKILLLFLLATCISITSRAQYIANTYWISYDTTNTPDIFWHFTSDTMWFSVNGIDYDSVDTFTETMTQISLVDIFYPGPNYCGGTGIYTKVFSADTMWLVAVSDTCSDRADFMSSHYFISNPMSVSETVIPEFTIAPNPCVDIVNISSTQAADKIIVTTTDGKVVIEHTPKSGSASVDLGKYPPGVYFISLVYTDRVTTKMIIRE